MSRLVMPTLKRGAPTVVIAAILLAASATSGATAALMITGKEIKDNTVTTKDIKNGTLKTSDMKSSTVSALKGAAGPAGPAGPVGPAGPTGPAGPAGITGYQLVSNSALVAANDGGGVSVACPTGKRLLSGAASWRDGYDGTQVDVDISTTAATAWGWNYLDTSDILTVEVICATVS